MTEDELHELYAKKGIQFNQLAIDSVMHQLDLDGNGVFEAKEFPKTIESASRKVPLPR